MCAPAIGHRGSVTPSEVRGPLRGCPEPTEVGDLVRRALALNRPALVEVRVGRMPRPPFFFQLKSPEKYRR